MVPSEDSGKRSGGSRCSKANPHIAFGVTLPGKPRGETFQGGDFAAEGGARHSGFRERPYPGAGKFRIQLCDVPDTFSLSKAHKLQDVFAIGGERVVRERPSALEMIEIRVGNLEQAHDSES